MATKGKTVYVGGRKGKLIGPDPRDPEEQSLVDYEGDIHRERNSDISTKKGNKKG